LWCTRDDFVNVDRFSGLEERKAAIVKLRAIDPASSEAAANVGDGPVAKAGPT
jgi:hypothetical protein